MDANGAEILWDDQHASGRDDGAEVKRLDDGRDDLVPGASARPVH